MNVNHLTNSKAPLSQALRTINSVTTFKSDTAKEMNAVKAQINSANKALQMVNKQAISSNKHWAPFGVLFIYLLSCVIFSSSN